jgi:hypothetical protein
VPKCFEPASFSSPTSFHVVTGSSSRNAYAREKNATLFPSTFRNVCPEPVLVSHHIYIYITLYYIGKSSSFPYQAVEKREKGPVSHRADEQREHSGEDVKDL